MSKIETYVNFNDYPLFNPMFNPNQMLAYGIHEGVAINPKHGITFETGVLEDLKGKGFLKESGLTEDKYWAQEPSVNNNHYKCLEVVPPFTDKKVITSLDWFHWYTKLYYGARGPLDKTYIDWWYRVVLWGFTEAPKTHEVDQMLLQYSWNPGWEPKILPDYLNRK